MNEELDVARRALEAAGSDDAAAEVLQPFLDALMSLSQQPDAREGLEAFAAETSALVANAVVALGRYSRAIERFVDREFYSDEWYGVAYRRSALEWVRDLYGARAQVEHASWMFVEDLDDMIKHKGDQEGPVEPTRVPPGTPSAHWWWWYPAAPPV